MKSLASLVAIIGMSAGCAAATAARDSENLSDTVRSFNESMRWERFEKAAVRLPIKQRAQAVDDWDDRAHDLKITDWELVKIDPRGDKEARAQIKLSWYKESEQILRETQSLQTWERHGKEWVLVDEARLRGAEMPGLMDGRAKPDRAKSDARAMPDAKRDEKR